MRSKKAKMSEILIDVAEPWLRRMEPEIPHPVAAATYEIVGLIWNASRLDGEPGGPRRVAKIVSGLRKDLPNLEHRDVKELVREIYERALDRYPDERRAVIGTLVSPARGGRIRLEVVSAGEER